MADHRTLSVKLDRQAVDAPWLAALWERTEAGGYRRVAIGVAETPGRAIALAGEQLEAESG